MSAPGKDVPEQLVQITTTKPGPFQLFPGQKESLLLLCVFTSGKQVHSR